MASKLWIAAGLWACAFALPAAAQEPKPGDWYEDNTDLGFKVRVPAKWQSIPPAPDDGNLVIKYDPKSNKSVQIGKDKILDLHVWIVKFDRRKKAPDQPTKGADKTFVARDRNLTDWIGHKAAKGFTVASQEQTEVSKMAATEFLYSNVSEPGVEVKLYAMVYKLRPDVDVAFVGWGPGDGAKWNRFERAFQEMARSFKTVEVKESKPALAEGSSLRDRKRAELADAVTRTPGWKLYESANYFIISDYPKKDFIEELMGRLEAIHAVYELDYPAAKAKEIREAAARVKTGDGAAGKTEEKPEAPAPKPVEVPIDSSELSRCSVVRVCKNPEEYHSYGGPGGSAGYWNSNAKELVVYDASTVGGKGDTWITLNHEAFHQYIFYFYGNIAPHSWYNEGTGDFYSGYMYKNGHFTLKENPWRKDEIKEAIRDGKHEPLKGFMRFTQADYYRSDRIGVCYAQGWSLIYFLRTGKKNKAKGWDPKWDSLLENYLQVLTATGKPEQAVEQCLTGIDLDALEAAWIDYTK
jgi:hypothetical protein